jgi:hypothetical protein
MTAGIVGKERGTVRDGDVSQTCLTFFQLLNFRVQGVRVQAFHKFQGVMCHVLDLTGLVPDDEMFKVPEILLRVMTGL